MVAQLFSCLERAPDYDGNHESDLIPLIGGEKYGLEEVPASIGLLRWQAYHGV